MSVIYIWFKHIYFKDEKGLGKAAMLHKHYPFITYIIYIQYQSKYIDMSVIYIKYQTKFITMSVIYILVPE